MIRMTSMSRVLAVSAVAFPAGLAIAQGGACHVPPLQFRFDVQSPPTMSGDVSVTAEGDYLYVVAPFLEIYDISDPTAPLLVGPGLTAGGYAIEIRGTTAYIGGRRSLRIVDVTDPTSATLIGFYSQSSSGSSFGVNPFALGDDLAIVRGSNTSSIQIIDITNPSTPTAVLNLAMGSTVNDAALMGDTAYVATTNGLVVLDLSTPASPVTLTTYLPGTSISAPVLSGDTLFLATDSTIEAVDVSSPGTPVGVGSIAVNAGNGMEIDADRLVTASGSVIDISDPAAMTVEDELDFIGFSMDPWISGDRAFIATLYTGVYGFVLDDHPSPEPVDATVSAFNSDLVITGDLVLTANGAAGVDVVDASNPAAPVVVGSVDTPSHAMGIDVSGTIACVADDNGGLQVIDFSNPSSPMIVGSLPVFDQQGDPSQAVDVTIIGNNAYVVVRGNTFSFSPSTSVIVVDISNPSSPTLINTINTGIGSAVHRRIDSDGDLLAVLTSHYDSATGSFPNHSCMLVDVSNPMAPVVGPESGFHSGSSATDIRIRDGYVRTANAGSFERSSSLKTFSYTPALSLQLVDQALFGGTIFSLYPRISHQRIALGNGVMYATVGEGLFWNSVAEYDLSDPETPRLVGIYNMGGTGGGIDATGSRVVFGDDSRVGFLDFEPCADCVADVNQDGSLTPADFSAWLAAFNAMSPRCDQNADGQCTPADFSAWLVNYNAGC